MGTMEKYGTNINIGWSCYAYGFNNYYGEPGWGTKDYILEDGNAQGYGYPGFKSVVGDGSADSLSKKIINKISSYPNTGVNGLIGKNRLDGFIKCLLKEEEREYSDIVGFDYVLNPRVFKTSSDITEFKLDHRFTKIIVKIKAK